MITAGQYATLWNDYFAPIPEIGEMPNYQEFLISEAMLQDYLDIFRGVNTRGNAVIRGLLAGIAMPYPHPFFNPDGTPILDEAPCIQYILVAEVRRPNQYQTYFYNLDHNNPTTYLSAARKAWGCPDNLPKRDTLLCLASKGILLLDLFCFAIPLDTNKREHLNFNGATSLFWNNPANPYNLQSRIVSINNLLCENWDLALIAPCKISKYIKDTGFPPIASPTPGIHPGVFNHLHPDGTRCINAGGIPCEWKKIAVAQQGPSANLLRIAFDL
jgi:hypothetical protein